MDPIPELFRSDADLLLIFLSGNGVHFLEETNDPWYRGNVPGGVIHYDQDGTIGSRSTYQPQEAASPMGCIMQYQYCNAMDQCGGLSSFADSSTSASLAFYGTIDGAWNDDGPVTPTALRFVWYQSVLASALVGLGDILASLGGLSLISHRSLEHGFLGPLPDDQGQLNVAYWWGTTLASYQEAFINAANGPQDASLLPYTQSPADSHAETLCNNQVS